MCVRGVGRGTHWLSGAARCEGTPVIAVKVSGAVCAAPGTACECSGSDFSLNTAHLPIQSSFICVDVFH